MKKKSKIGICLGSGGMRGVAHLGFLQALEENKIPIDLVVGCSIGAIVGSFYCNGYSPQELYEYVKKIKLNNVFDLNVSVFRKKSFLRGQKAEKIMKEFLGDKNIEDFKIPFACTATDILTGNQHVFTSGNAVTAVRASFTIPVIFSLVEHENMLLIDGGITNRTPVDVAHKLGADKVITMDLLKEIPECTKLNNIFDVFFRSLEIVTFNIHLPEENPSDLILFPELGSANQAKFDSHEFCYEKGYEVAIKNMDKIKKLVFED